MLPKSYNRYGVQVNTGYDLQVQQHLPNTCRPNFYLRRFSESMSSTPLRPYVRPKHFRVPSLCNL